MRLKYLDVLKAFAIIAVVLYHAGFMPFGYLGVDLFLVINGYLITGGLSRKLISDKQPIDYKGPFKHYYGFELGRVERLLPPLLLAGVVCMAIGFFVMIDDTYESLSQSVIATNFFGNNVVELIASGDYWASSKVFSPLMHTWYVGLIMQFYLVYPILFYIARIDKNNSQKTFLTLLVVLGIISLLLFIGETNTARRFYLLHTRFFEFAAGGIVALLYKPESNKVFNKGFVFCSYVLILALFSINTGIIPANVKLLLVVSLSCILLCSQDVLENKITGNELLAKVGAASYSIFIWHQVVLAFYRCINGSEMDLKGFFICFIIFSFLSWLSYRFIEQRTLFLLRSNLGKRRLYISYGILFLVLNSITFIVYKNAGVVRDIPELEVVKTKPQRGIWPKYNDKIFSLDKTFETNKQHWFVIGNSFGRDFANIILESEVADSVEVSYCGIGEYLQSKYEERFLNANKIFISSKDISEEDIRRIELLALAFGHAIEDVIVVGEKYFGETMTEIYAHRFFEDYYSTKVYLKQPILEKNECFKTKYANRFIDLIELTKVNGDKVKVFTDDNYFISSDCIHLTQKGAAFFAKRIDWSLYF